MTRTLPTGESRHIALFLSAYSGGGAQRRMLTLARGFAARGHRVDVVTADPAGQAATGHAGGPRHIALDTVFSHWPALRRYKGPRVLAAAPALATYLRRERPDVLLSTSSAANLAALWARQRAGGAIPVVATVNVHFSESTGARQAPWGRLLRQLLRRAYPGADAIIAISHGVAEDLARATAVPRQHITTIYNPVDVAMIARRASEAVEHPWLAEGAPPLLLAVGKLKRQKDFATLLRAFQRLRAERPAHLVILGEGEERRRLEALVSRLGIAGDVVLAGFTENPFAWMARAAVLVLSSAWEGLSNVLLEALACGCPVVSTDCPSGPAEILENGAYGTLVPVGDVAALATAIAATLDRPPDRARLRARAREFSVDAAVEAYLAVLLAVRRGITPAPQRQFTAAPQPTRVGLLVRSLTGGGMERTIVRLANGFAARGYATSLLVGVDRGAMREEIAANVRLVRLPSVPRPFALLRLLRAAPDTTAEVLPLFLGAAPRLLGCVPALARTLREEHLDALLSAGTQANLAALWARRFGGSHTRLTISERNTMSSVAAHARHRFRRRYPSLARREYPAADAIVAVSGGVADDLCRLTGLPRERVVTIRNPVVGDALQRQAAEPVPHPWLAGAKEPVVLAAGRLHRQKDFPTLLRAFARVRATRPAHLIILGEGDERESLVALAAALGIAGDIALPGFTHNPFAWMAKASVFVLSSAWEGTANVLIEALACGCPVVSTDCPSGPAEVLDGGAFGELVPVGDAAAMAAAILRVLTAPPSRERLRARADLFAYDSAVERYLDVLLDRPSHN